MLKETSVINDAARGFMIREIDKHFQFKNGSNLDAVVDEVCNDKDLFTFLAAFLPNESGIYLSHMNFFDDIEVNVHYGLTIPFKDTPRKTRLFTYENTGMPIAPKIIERGSKVHVVSYLPTYEEKGGCTNYPTPEQFVNRLNKVLKNPRDFVVKGVKK